MNFHKFLVDRTTLPYACFCCRRSFKRWVSSDFRVQPATLTCPACGYPAVCLSPKFKPPKRSDLEQWRKVQALVAGGCFFYSHSDPYPEHLSEVPAFLAARRAEIERLMKLTPDHFIAITKAAMGVVI
jgi:hypothetical protein